MSEVGLFVIYVELRDAIAKAGGISNFCRAANLSVGYVHDVTNGRTAPGGSILSAIGYRKVIKYEKITEALQ